METSKKVQKLVLFLLALGLIAFYVRKKMNPEIGPLEITWFSDQVSQLVCDSKIDSTLNKEERKPASEVKEGLNALSTGDANAAAQITNLLQATGAMKSDEPTPEDLKKLFSEFWTQKNINEKDLERFFRKVSAKDLDSFKTQTLASAKKGCGKDDAKLTHSLQIVVSTYRNGK